MDKSVINKRVMQIVSIWATSVFLFSGVYLALWSTRPDSFILHKEFNLSPYEELRSALWDVNPQELWGRALASRAQGAMDIDEFTRVVRQMDSAARKTLMQLEQIKSEQEKLESTLKVATKIHSDVMWSRLETYKEKALSKEINAEKAATQNVELLEKTFGKTPNASGDLAIANARVTAAQAAYRAAVKRAEVGGYVLANLNQFTEQSAVKEMAILVDSLKENTLKQSALFAQISDLRKAAHDSLKDWYAARQSRLDWLDFLYFSVGVSTTTTFGDIVPNTRAARAAVLFQLVLSVLIVGCLVSLLAPNKE